jgi:hypothetical protein
MFPVNVREITIKNSIRKLNPNMNKKNDFNKFKILKLKERACENNIFGMKINGSEN